MIAEKQAIPSRYLEEIIGELRKAGFVVGKRGPRGGYRLAKPPSEIVVSDVIDVLTTASTVTGESQDEITRLVEDSVDQRFLSAVGELSLEQLIGEAREQHRRRAANYVI